MVALTSCAICKRPTLALDICSDCIKTEYPKQNIKIKELEDKLSWTERKLERCRKVVSRQFNKYYGLLNKLAKAEEVIKLYAVEGNWVEIDDTWYESEIGPKPAQEYLKEK